ncbi:MAG: hypothetical protein OXD46_05130, partial [Chloroflexi bacterium]|nr:hypothetical protein [Chloroflexota bacterium]
MEITVQTVLALWNQDLPFGVQPRMLQSKTGPVPDPDWEMEVRTAQLALLCWGRAPGDATGVLELVDAEPDHPGLVALNEVTDDCGAWDGLK